MNRLSSFVRQRFTLRRRAVFTRKSTAACFVVSTKSNGVGSCRSYKILASDAGRAPPPDLYAAHEEWFWPRGPAGATTYGQLCWTNISLLKFVAARTKEVLRQQPEATIISISQNDNRHFCNDTAERAVIEAEGSPMGPLLRAVNYVAAVIANEFPLVAVDTLAWVLLLFSHDF